MHEEYCFLPPERTVAFCLKKKANSKVNLLVVLFYTENENFPLQIPKLYKHTDRALSQVGEMSCREAQGGLWAPIPGQSLAYSWGCLPGTEGSGENPAQKWKEKCRKQVLS